MLSANFKPKRIAAASRGFLAIARLSCHFGGFARNQYPEMLYFHLKMHQNALSGLPPPGPAGGVFLQKL